MTIRIQSVLIGLAVLMPAMLLVPAPGRAQDAAEAQRLREACRDGRGDTDACVDYGHRLYNAIGVDKDHAAALRIWRAACDRNSAMACANAGAVYRWSDVLPQNPAQAFVYFEKACGLSNGAACLQIGYMRRDGIGVAADAEMARRGFSLACTNNNGEGCVQEGRIYADGLGNVPKHEGNAVNSFRAGCSQGYMEACALVGYMAFTGRGMTVDAGLAVRQYQTACAGGVTFACGNLESIRNAGEGSLGYAELAAREAAANAFPSDLPPAQRFILASAAWQGGNVSLALAGFEALTEERFPDAAYTLGQIYWDGGQGVAMDRPRAVRYFQRAADGGHPYAQFAMAHFYYSGFIVARNEIWAIQTMRAAHETGGIAEAGPIWQAWQAAMNNRYDERDRQNQEMERQNRESAAAAEAANMARVWSVYSNRQNQQENGQVCGTIYRNNQANHECMARETFDRYYNPNR